MSNQVEQKLKALLEEKRGELEACVSIFDREIEGLKFNLDKKEQRIEEYTESHHSQTAESYFAGDVKRASEAIYYCANSMASLRADIEEIEDLFFLEKDELIKE